MPTDNWTVIRLTNGKIKLWRDYGNVAFGSPAYTVLGYITGTYRNARRYVMHLPKKDYELLDFDVTV
jgi:hypothetical protein